MYSNESEKSMFSQVYGNGNCYTLFKDFFDHSINGMKLAKDEALILYHYDGLRRKGGKGDRGLS